MVCGGCPTKKELKARGYEVKDVLCDLCGAAPDGLRHRLIGCRPPKVVTAREKFNLPWLDRFAESGESHDERLLRGYIPHPGCFAVRPNGSAKVEVRYPDSTAREDDWRDFVFFDGSATRERVAELNRAAFAAVLQSDLGFMRAVVTGPVPAHLPQTA